MAQYTGRHPSEALIEVVYCHDHISAQYVYDENDVEGGGKEIREDAAEVEEEYRVSQSRKRAEMIPTSMTHSWHLTCPGSKLYLWEHLMSN